MQSKVSYEAEVWCREKAEEGHVTREDGAERSDVASREA